MSKFKCTTETENEIANGPLVFFQLEALVNNFVNETLDFHQEFNTKVDFVNEQFMKVYKNEQEIENIFNMALKLQQDFSVVEKDLQVLEALFQQFKNTAENLEISSKMDAFCIKNVCGCGCCQFCCCKSERQKFTELLEDTNRKVEEIPGLLEGMRELDTYGELKNPYLDIIAILYYHCEILKNTEKNINSLADKLPLIELQVLSLKGPVKHHLTENV